MHLLLFLVIFAGGLTAGAAVAIVIQRRLTTTGRVECALRPERPTTWGTPGKWRHGIATAAPRTLSFRPVGPAGLRFPRGALVDIDVLAARVDQGRRPSLRQVWSINPTLHIATLSTADGPVELAASARNLPDVVKRLQPPH